jgi:hypothetical protein
MSRADLIATRDAPRSSALVNFRTEFRLALTNASQQLLEREKPDVVAIAANLFALLHLSFVAG